VALIIGDIIAIVTSFLYAYLIRIHIDSRPYYFESNPSQFVLATSILLPVWIFILFALGLYNKNVILNRSKASETLRLLTASIIGVMSIITVDFFLRTDLFPVRPIALYAMLTCFLSLFIMRTVIKGVRNLILRQKIGLRKVLIIGNSENTVSLIDNILGFPEEGYKIVGIISKASLIPKDLRKTLRYSSLKKALEKTKPDIIFQTDENKTEYVYKQAIEKHLLYYFVPTETSLSTHLGELELVGNTPAILVKATPLIGGAKATKRTMDLILGGVSFSPDGDNLYNSKTFKSEF